MPLGNMTSQFFANLYLNDLDYFIKHRLRMKYYLRYVDDFIILHKDKRMVEICKDKISKYLMNLRLELHPSKSKVFSMYRGVNLLGFKEFYFYRLARKRNVKYFNKKLIALKIQYKENLISYGKFIEKIQGWFAYAMWGNTYKLRRKIIRNIERFLNYNNSPKDKGQLNKTAKIQ